MNQIKIYKDKAGNTLWKRYLKTRSKWQFFATNKQGKIVDQPGVLKIMSVARAHNKLKVPKLPKVPVTTINLRKTKVRTYKV